jgi:putative ABC transport system substrate-binding protein
MKRREFITLLGGAATWPLAAHAQPRERMRRIGVLMNLSPDDPEGQDRLAAFLQGLQEAGWAVGRNVRVDTRWPASDPDRLRRYVEELVALTPDVIFATTNRTVTILQEATRTIPIVFAAVTDPVPAGFVDSLARPGGNTTGFTSAEYGMSAKWLQLLKEIAPGVTRVGVLHEPSNPGSLPQFAAIQVAAPSFRVELHPIGVHDSNEIERAIATFARSPNAGLIVTRITEAIAHRELIVMLAARYRLPAIYPLRPFAVSGGLISYGPDIVDQHRQAAGYVDRILKGEKPAELPVQAPTKYELMLNVKAAKALGLDVPASVFARADEIIE